MTIREKRAVKAALKDVAGRLLDAAVRGGRLRLVLPEGREPEAETLALVLDELVNELVQE